MSSKNAYEIRLEILKEANSNLWNEYNNRLEGARRNAIAALNGEEHRMSGEYVSAVKAPAPEDIIAYADKLYKFVSQE